MPQKQMSKYHKHRTRQIPQIPQIPQWKTLRPLMLQMPQSALPSLRDGQSFGDWNQMESIISTDCDSRTASKYHKNCGEQPDRAARLHHKSSAPSMDAKAVVATKKAASKPIGLEAELSLLQANFESGLEAGLKAKIYQTNGIAIIELHGVSICGICQAWTARKECPACGNSLT